MDDPDDLDYALEWKLRAVAIPVAFGLALLFHASPTGHAVQRTFLTMIPHELGHAVTAWLGGYPAIPSLWKTVVFGRSTMFALLLAALTAAVIYRGWQSDDKPWIAAGVVLGVLQLLLGLASDATAQAAITFGGDAGAMILGTLLVLAFFAPQGSRLRHGGLRWGLLVIGAATVVDTFATWWSARTDQGAIPYGEIEGVGLSDPSKLEQLHGWTTQTMIDRYVTVGAAGVIVVIAVYIWGVRAAYRNA